MKEVATDLYAELLFDVVSSIMCGNTWGVCNVSSVPVGSLKASTWTWLSAHLHSLHTSEVAYKYTHNSALTDNKQSSENT
jgi:hypothetical protein